MTPQAIADTVTRNARSPGALRVAAYRQRHDLVSFTGSYPVRAVRQCSGLDGRCTCAGETGHLESAIETIASDLTL